MVDPTLVISIDRTTLALDPLLLSGSNDGTALGVTAYSEPAMQARVGYAGTSAWQHGDVSLSWSWQQTLLTFTASPEVASEAEARALYSELLAAVTQGLNYLVTTTVNGAPPEVWTCQPGSIGGFDRGYIDLRDHNPQWPVTIPCHPVRS